MQNSSEIFDANGKWQTAQDMPITLQYHCMVTVNATTVAVIGGREKWNEYHGNKTFFYNVKSRVWTRGPDLQIGRSGHSCGMVRQSNGSDKFSILVAGGLGAGRSVEILDEGSNSWRNGSNLIDSSNSAAMVEEWTGSVVLVGGNGISDKLIFRLDHAGEGHEWQRLRQMLAMAHNGHTAFLVPDDYANCTLT